MPDSPLTGTWIGDRTGSGACRAFSAAGDVVSYSFSSGPLSYALRGHSGPAGTVGLGEERAAEGSSVRLSGKKQEGAVPRAPSTPSPLQERAISGQLSPEEPAPSEVLPRRSAGRMIQTSREQLLSTCCRKRPARSPDRRRRGGLQSRVWRLKWRPGSEGHIRAGRPEQR